MIYMHIHIHVFIYIYIHVRARVHKNVCVCIQTCCEWVSKRVSLYEWVGRCVCVCPVCVCVCVCVSVRACVCVCERVRVHRNRHRQAHIDPDKYRQTNRPTQTQTLMHVRTHYTHVQYTNPYARLPLWMRLQHSWTRNLAREQHALAHQARARTCVLGYIYWALYICSEHIYSEMICICDSKGGANTRPLFI